MLRAHLDGTVVELDCQHRIAHVISGPLPDGWDEPCRQFERLNLVRHGRPLRIVWKVRTGAIGAVWDADTLGRIDAVYSLS